MTLIVVTGLLNCKPNQTKLNQKGRKQKTETKKSVSQRHPKINLISWKLEVGTAS